MSGVTPHELAIRPQDLIVDIRPLEEREGELGYIPGSVSLPEDALARSPGRLVELAHSRNVVLVCLSGRRALRRLEALREVEATATMSLGHLEGGLLRWGAEGFPYVLPHVAPSGPKVRLESLRDFPRAVVSCFVAESIETQLDAGRGDLEDPSRVVESFFGQALANGEASPALFRTLLDQLADQARQMGHSLDHIAVNLQTMRSALQPFDAGSASAKPASLKYHN